MKRISSFAVNHDILQEGMYFSRVDGDVTTYDIRMKKPNGGDYLPNAAIHTFEHVFATFARNSEFSQSIIYVGPMGCRTGFYLLVRDTLSHENALILVKQAFVFIAKFQGEIPGCHPFECGNYKEHNLHGAKEMARDMLVVLEGWSTEKMNYEESKM